MKSGKESRLVFLLSITLLLISSSLYLPSSAILSARSPIVTDQVIEDNDIFVPLVRNEYSLLCWQGIANGSFEENSDWIFPTTEYPAGYSSTVVFTGTRSMRAGIGDSSMNRFSYSSAKQTVSVPFDATNSVLSFQLYGKSTEVSTVSLLPLPLDIKIENAAGSGDAQLVSILDSNGVELERLLTIRTNEQLWKPYAFDLSHYAGQTIQIYFGVYNNGWSGVTSMYIDDVSLESCDDPDNPSCWQGIANESFEEDSGWTIPITEYPAAYSTDQANTGTRSMRTGIVYNYDNRYSYSSTSQYVTIPGDAAEVAITFSLYPTSSEPVYLGLPTVLENREETDAVNWGDVQNVIINDSAGQELERLVHMRRNDSKWLHYSFNLSEYAGETIQLYFGVINNGQYGITGMYVDDVYVRSCTQAP